MIDFNVPPYVGTELKYVAEAVGEESKICGDGPFTKRWQCMAGGEDRDVKSASDDFLHACHRDGSTAG